jgi:putative colanic acid biosynthesis UDP-glucose lipid carrier transferase
MKDNQSLNLYNYLRYIKLILIVGDLIFLNISFLVAIMISYGDLLLLHNKDYQIFLFVANMFWLFLVYHFNEFTFSRVNQLVKCLIKSMTLISYLFLALFIFTRMFTLDKVSNLELFFFFLNFLNLTMVYRVTTIFMLKKIRKSGNTFRNVVIVGAGTTGTEIYNELSNDLSQGYKILGYFDDNPENTRLKTNFLGPVSQLKEFALDQHIHEIYVAMKDFDTATIKELINFCERNLIRVKFIPDYKLFKETNNNVSVDFYGHVPVVSLRVEPLEIPINRIKKRFFDILFSLLVIVFIFPWLFPILIILVKFSSKGPVFFRQKRSGEGNKYFWCLKFRTMRVNESSDTRQASFNDDRVTKIGKFMRKTNLDEMPQFFNVLIGNMSVVGPRPHMIKHTEHYSELIDNYLVRHYTKPGITGWAQTNGFRGETKNVEKMVKRVEYDIWYIENWSFLLELKIIFFTVRNMFFHDPNAF